MCGIKKSHILYWNVLYVCEFFGNKILWVFVKKSSRNWPFFSLRVKGGWVVRQNICLPI